MNIKPWLLCFLPSLLYAAPATPKIPDFVLQQTAPLNFRRVVRNPDHYKGRYVLWGGPILSMTQDAGGCELEILQLPLNPQGKPTNPEISWHHFFVKLPPSIELPADRVGHRITVYGEVLGREIVPLPSGMGTRSDPLVLAESVYLWPDPSKPELPYEYPDWWGSYWDYEWSQAEWKTLFGYPR